MSPRPNNPPPDRRQEILDAALRVFSTKGYGASTNADIAREAGVTPAALYYYFPSKADLFRAALTERKDTITGNVEQMVGHLLEMQPEVVFPMVLRAASGLLVDERSQAILRIFLLEGPKNPEIIEIYKTDVVGALVPVVMKYIQGQMNRGRLRPMDPRLFLVLLTSPIMAMTIARDILNLDMMQDLTNETVVREIVETILPAMLGETKE